MEVTPVRSRRDRAEFIDLPYRLHGAEPHWIPPLRLERRLFLSPRMNAFFRHGEAQLFLARRDSRVVGRISAQIDHAFNAFHGNAWGMFGFLEFEDDAEVLAALLAQAAAWLTERGRDRMVGPMDFSMNDESGVLIEGHDRDPVVKAPWQPPYYSSRCEETGLEKAMDLLFWEADIANSGKILPVMVELAERLEPEHGIRIRKMTRRGLRRDLDRFAEVYNAAWSENWGFVPYSEKDLDHYAQELQLVFDRNWFMVAEKGDETVGVAISVPDINQVLRRMNGRLLPLGWLHYLRRQKIIDRVRVGFLGVKPEYQHAGVAAGLYVEHFHMAAATPQRRGVAGWVLETNEAMIRGMEAMGAQLVSRHRLYQQMLV